jgi:hypothetical protein
MSNTVTVADDSHISKSATVSWWMQSAEHKFVTLRLCGRRGGRERSLELSASEARELAAYLNAAADVVEAAQAK